MPARRAVLAAAFAALPGIAAARGLAPRRWWDDALGEMPICRGGIHRVQAEGRQREARTVEEADADLLERIGLLEGHLIIGRDLLRGGLQRLALPHFGHPVAELYSWLEPRIAQRGVQPFEAELQALEARAQANDAGAGFDAAWAPVFAKTTALKRTVPPERLAGGAFMIVHIAQMVEDVAGDYGESIERGRISNVLEYHDSMGFLRYAILVAGEAPGGERAAAAWKSILAELRQLEARAYPKLEPPTRPPVAITSIRSLSDRVLALASTV